MPLRLGRHFFIEGIVISSLKDRDIKEGFVLKIKDNFNHTVYASFLGYIVQAIVNNFAPLLFLTFQSTYSISLDMIALLVTVNFGIQLVVDLLASKFVDKIGYRVCIVAAHLFSAAGLVGLTLFPEWFSDPYIGLLAAVTIYAIGGGLIEVLISPIVDACPTKRKEAVMSLLHSFYCWGHVFVVLMSTLFFYLAGIGSWKILALVWAAVPLLNALYFSRVPLRTLTEGSEGLGLRKLVKMKAFWLLLLLMMCAGACEQSVSQWASTFAESGLGVSKTVGDLAGPCAFAVLMGGARVFYAKYSEKINLQHFMLCSGALCLVSYLLVSLVPVPQIGLVGCGLCGLSVGILWPGTFSIAAKEIRAGGTALFAFLALAGDLGCSGGPTFVGFVSGAFGGNLRIGLFAAILFPILLIAGLLAFRWMKRRQAASDPV